MFKVKHNTIIVLAIR